MDHARTGHVPEKARALSYRAQILKLLSDIRSGYWFIPATLVVVAILLSRIMVRIDSGDGAGAFLPDSMTNTTVEGARTLLSIIAQSVIGVAGVTFSITMVAVAHASSQFGPRLIGNFMRDRGTQWSLGILISTFVYALLVLRSVEAPFNGGDAQFVPQLAIILALGLALASVMTVIYYVHHVPEMINVSNITAALGRTLIASVEATAHDGRGKGGRPDLDLEHPLTLEVAGYVQQVNLTDLQRLATEHDLHVHIVSAPGRFVIAGAAVAQLSRAPPEDSIANFRRCFALGPERSGDQDVMFLVDQQVEVIARALSPGINDPQTAITCLSWLAAGLAAADRAGPCFGLSGEDRVSIARLDWADLLRAGFGESLPYIRDDAMVMVQWRGLLAQLKEQVNAENIHAIDALLLDV